MRQGLKDGRGSSAAVLAPQGRYVHRATGGNGASSRARAVILSGSGQRGTLLRFEWEWGGDLIVKIKFV